MPLKKTVLKCLWLLGKSSRDSSASKDIVPEAAHRRHPKGGYGKFSAHLAGWQQVSIVVIEHQSLGNNINADVLMKVGVDDASVWTIPVRSIVFPSHNRADKAPSATRNGHAPPQNVPQ
eukprot:6475558-Amphidinium_carterae.1